MQRCVLAVDGRDVSSSVALRITREAAYVGNAAWTIQLVNWHIAVVQANRKKEKLTLQIQFNQLALAHCMLHDILANTIVEHRTNISTSHHCLT